MIRKFGEERKKEEMNLWKFWINLEFHYGGEESLVKVFGEALKKSISTVMIDHLTSLAANNGKIKEAEQHVKLHLRKNPNKLKAWLKIIQFYLENQEKLKNQDSQEKVKDYVKRSL